MYPEISCISPFLHFPSVWLLRKWNKRKKMDLDPGFYLFLHFLIMWNWTQLNQIIQLLLVEWWLFFSWDPNNENPKALKRQFLLDKMKFCIVYIRSLWIENHPWTPSLPFLIMLVLIINAYFISYELHFLTVLMYLEKM